MILGVLSCSASAAVADTYSVDFFPDEPQTFGLYQLLFVPTFAEPNLEGATITGSTVHLAFTTGSLDDGTPFDAAGLTFVMTAAVNGPGDGFIYITGADLGWSGNGTFTATVPTSAFNGTIVPGRWSFDLSGPLDDVGELHPFAGSFSADSRVELTYTPVCRADFNGDGNRSVQDIFDFLTAYFANDAAADIDNSGDVSVQDIFDFLALYFAGCNE